MKGFLKSLFAVAIVMLMVPTAQLPGTYLPIVGFVALCAIAGMLIPKQNNSGLTTNGVNLEFWVKYIIERFWKDNLFLKYCYNDDQYVVGGRIVHIPQPGAKPVVIINRSSYPATAVRRTDTDITYALDEFTTDPTHITDIQKVEMSYSMMDSVLGDHMSTLSETIADSLLIKWATNTTSIVRTTGGTAATQVGPVGSQTGNRYGLHPDTLKKLMIQFNVQNVPKTDRYVLLDDNMYEFFYDSLTQNQLNVLNQYADAKNGIIGRLHGFDIFTRSSVLTATVSTDVIKAIGAAGAAGDNLTSFAWHKNSVTRAMGEVKMFQDLMNPLYYGDIYSALTRMGGRVRRANAEGVALIIQGVPA